MTSTASTKPAWLDFAVACFWAAIVLALVDAGVRGTQLSRAVTASSWIPVKSKLLREGRFDVVLAGSSVIAEGINPSVVSARLQELTGQTLAVFNAGVSGGGFNADYLTANHILELPKDQRPKIYVISVNPLEFSCCPNVEMPSHAKWGAALRFADLGPLLLAAPSFEEASNDLALIAFRALAIRPEILATLYEYRGLPPPASWPADGGGGTIPPVDPVTQDVRAQGRARSYAIGMLKPKTVDRWAPRRYIKTMVERMAKVGIKVILLGNPQAPQLETVDGPDSICPEYEAHAAELGAELGIGFTNFRQVPWLGAADFVDGDHLASPGAAKFSRRVAEVIAARLTESP